MVSFKDQGQRQDTSRSDLSNLTSPINRGDTLARPSEIDDIRRSMMATSVATSFNAATEKTAAPVQASPQTASVGAQTREQKALERAIENSPHKEELKILERKLGQAKSPEEAAQTLTQIRAILTGATGNQSIEEFRKNGLDKLLENLKKATEEVKESYGHSLGRPSTLIPVLRTMEQEKAVKAWSEACDKVREYIKKNVGNLNPDSYRAALELSQGATMDGVRAISDLTTTEQNRAQNGMAVSGIVLAASGTTLAALTAIYAARSGNPNAIAAAAGFAAANLEHDRFIKDIALTAKNWDEYKKLYADGFDAAAKRAAVTGLVVAVATRTILGLKAGAIPINSLSPSGLSQHCAALAMSFEVTFGAKLGQDVLQNLAKGLSLLAQGKNREGLKALGDAGIDTAQLGYLGKLIEGWVPTKIKPAATAPNSGTPAPRETAKPEPKPNSDPNSRTTEPAPLKPSPEKPRTVDSGKQEIKPVVDSVFNRSPSAKEHGANAWQIGNNRRLVTFGPDAKTPTPAEVKHLVDIANAPIRGKDGKPEAVLDIMGGKKSQIKDAYCIDLKFEKGPGAAGKRGDVLKEIAQLPDASLDTVVINNPKTENLDLTKEMLASLLSKLKPGGRIIITGQASKNPECDLNSFMGELAKGGEFAVVQNGTKGNPEMHPEIKSMVDSGQMQFNTTDGRPITSGLGSFTIVRKP